MANNRMVLVCNKCNPKQGEWQYEDKGVFVIAKYYPDTGYYHYLNWFENEKLNIWFEKHRHKVRSMWGGEPFRLEYEIEDNEIKEAR